MTLARLRATHEEAVTPSVLQALDCLRVAITLFDADERLTFANQHFTYLFKRLPPVGALLGKSYEELIRLEVESGAVTGVSDLEAFVERRRAQLFMNDFAPQDVTLADGRIIEIKTRRAGRRGWIALWTDVTEARHTLTRLHEVIAHSRAETMRQLADLSLQLDRTAAEARSTKTTLLRTMSHELKTPLNAIIGFSDLLGSLADRAGPEQIREYAGLIHQGGKNLLRLINQILDLTKISAGRYELNRQPIDASTALWRVREINEEHAFAKDIAIEVEAPIDEIAVDADENALSQMAGHLVENAVNFTQTGGEVRLSAVRAGAMVRITVADNGPGVAEEDLTRILEPFEQGGRATTDHEAGAGLGLTLVKSFAELHGGTLTLKSELGEGFTAILDLPAAR